MKLLARNAGSALSNMDSVKHFMRQRAILPVLTSFGPVIGIFVA